MLQPLIMQWPCNLGSYNAPRASVDVFGSPITSRHIIKIRHEGYQTWLSLAERTCGRGEAIGSNVEENHGQSRDQFRTQWRR